MMGCAAAAILGTTAAADEAAARVHSVVVYPDRAQVTRSREVACGDRVAVAFTGLPPAADAASLRAAVSVGRVDGLRSEDKPQTAAFSREAEDLDEQIRRVNQDLRAEAEARSRADGATRLAEGYAGVATRLISREMVEGPDIAAWRAANARSLRRVTSPCWNGESSRARVSARES